DPVCRRAREGVRQVWVAERDELVPGLRDAAAAARQLSDGAVDLGTGLARIREGLGTAERGSARLADAQATLRAGLGELADGTADMAHASGLVEGGTTELAGGIAQLGDGLDSAATYLRSAADATEGTDAAGFYLPPSALDDPRFALASGSYLSPDGRVARLIVLGATNAFGREAAARSGEVADSVRNALRDTGLADASVAVTGMAATNADIAELSQSDFRLVGIAALVAVFLVLLLLIRSLVAASFLLASVALSYAATMGLSIIVWQLLLDTPIEWTVACIAFVLLVAVGADYNLLLIKRVHEESPDGSRAGIARAVAVTGGVITAAGVIFAASLFAMMSGSVTTLVQLGFTTGLGLLIDTFVVRTLVVPAFAALVGPRLWWPSRAS
ncbi:MAG TPA: MMPL family transporter, partial [Marmoricola sp.]